MLPTAKNQKKRLTNRTGRCTIQLSTNRVTPPLSVPPPCRVFPLLPDNTPPQGALRRSLWPSWGGRKSSRKAALSSFPGEYLSHAAGQTARRQQRAAAPEHRSGVAAYCRHFKRREGALLQFRVPSFCRNRACTRRRSTACSGRVSSGSPASSCCAASRASASRGISQLRSAAFSVGRPC